MLKEHIGYHEGLLLACAQVQSTVGHTIHKGTPREVFVREFLGSHLPSNVAIGTGEIIDSESKPGESRNQHDIVIYKRSYPKLDFGGGVSGFLIESVIATIEVKSVLDQKEFSNAAKAAANCKSLAPSLEGEVTLGWVPPAVLNYVVAYDGPARMSTIHGWVESEYRKHGIADPALPVQPQMRLATKAPALDGVFVLGRGFMLFDNVPAIFASRLDRKVHPDLKWVIGDVTSGSLLLLFLLIQQATANNDGRWLEPGPYLADFSVPSTDFLP